MQLRVGFAGSAAIVALFAACAPVSESPEAGNTSQASSGDYLEQMSREYAVYYGLDSADVPDVDVIRYVMPEERQAHQDSCLKEAGYQVDGPGQLFFPPEQEAAAALDQYVCRMKYPPIERYSQPWGDRQVGIQYDWMVEFVIPCLEGEGHPITGIPSRDVFIDSYETDAFYPFSQIQVDQSGEDFNVEWERLESTCTQIAPSEVLWDGLSIDDWKAAHGE